MSLNCHEKFSFEIKNAETMQKLIFFIYVVLLELFLVPKHKK